MNSEAQPSPSDKVDLKAEFAATGISEVLETLDRELIGLVPVKKRIREIAALLLIDRERKRLGLSVSAPTLHMSFTGNPGVWRKSCTRWAMSEKVIWFQ
jgi:hypothetical protein